MLSSIVIGIASTAPAYSLAVTLGLVTAVVGVGLKCPAIMIVSFIPMILIASSYYYLNKADPDCGTTFSWVTRAIGPAHRLGDRLGHGRRRHHRHGQPGADHRHLLLPACSA